jgi:hypothetical protein
MTYVKPQITHVANAASAIQATKQSLVRDSQDPSNPKKSIAAYTAND